MREHIVPDSLSGQVAVVVGAGSSGDGLSNGQACALAYAIAGASVLCVDNNADRANETVQLIENNGFQARGVRADATDEAEMSTVIETAMDSFGRVDIMHNNVGVGGSSGAPDQIAKAEWDREIAQNLSSAYLGMRVAVPALRASNGGVIINTSSLLAVRFLKRPSVAYTTAKAAVEALTRASAIAYARENIRVNCIRIGFSETPLIKLALDERGITGDEADQAMQRSRSKVPLRQQHTSPCDVATAAAWLASDASRGITGVILNVDGGLEGAPI